MGLRIQPHGSLLPRESSKETAGCQGRGPARNPAQTVWLPCEYSWSWGQSTSQPLRAHQLAYRMQISIVDSFPSADRDLTPAGDGTLSRKSSVSAKCTARLADDASLPIGPAEVASESVAVCRREFRPWLRWLHFVSTGASRWLQWIPISSRCLVGVSAAASVTSLQPTVSGGYSGGGFVLGS